MRHIFGVYEFRCSRAVTGLAEIASLRVETSVARARKERVNDLEIHDRVPIAATSSVYNRYVDGLVTFTPSDPGAYDAMGAMIAEYGYGR